MEVTKRGNFAETQKQIEKQKLEKVKQEIEAVKNWSRHCVCSSCVSEFDININDIARSYSGGEDEIGSYGCGCPVCGREYTFSAGLLPMIGPKKYDLKSYYPKYDNSPGYEFLMKIFHKNRVECCERVENGYPKRLKMFKRYYY